MSQPPYHFGLEFIRPVVYFRQNPFLKLNELILHHNVDYAIEMKQHILRCTGLPVSIGVAPTKTLAKVANYVAKKKTLHGIFEITAQNVDELLATLAVDEIWGVGRKLGEKLRQRGIHTALDLKRTSPVTMRRQFNVILEKMVHELNGYSCLALDEVAPKHSITSSRSFGVKVIDLASLKEAIAHHCTKAAAKLRVQGSVAQGMYVFIKTSKHDDIQAYRHFGTALEFESPLNDTGHLISFAIQAVEKLFQPRLKYYKAGVILLNLVDAATLQPDFLSPLQNRDNLMAVMDEINQKYQRDSLFYAAEGLTQSWQAKRDKKSPNFTTNWKELPLAYAH